MARGRRGSASRRTEFLSNTPILTVSKYNGYCKNCGRVLKAGDGYVSRSPGDTKWELNCRNGCEDLHYHNPEKFDAEEAAQALGEEEERNAPPPLTTAEELRAEHPYG